MLDGLPGTGQHKEAGMSRQDAQSFLERLQHDAALRQAATKAIEARDTERLIAVGAEQGLSFTVIELARAWSEMQHPSGGGELTEKELESVAGGSKRVQLFDMLRAVIDKYNETAKGAIQTIGR
jgi:predicted ribosomally synthesized peptide with nif11-like leader